MSSEPYSYSAWALSTFLGVPLGSPRYYVDLAANHPTKDSNTYYLDRKGWRGLCIEPNPVYTELLQRGRSCNLSTNAVDDREHDVAFNIGGTMGGIEDPRFDNRRSHHASITVRARRLQDVLREFDAPREISFLSLDVEGAENAALAPTFAWSEYVFLCLAVERAPPDLNTRLFAHGYLFARTMGVADSIYVHSTHPRAVEVADNGSFVQQAAKCHNGKTQYHNREQLRGVKRCISVFGCCAFPGFPQSTTRYGAVFDQ